LAGRQCFLIELLVAFSWRITTIFAAFSQPKQWQRRMISYGCCFASEQEHKKLSIWRPPNIAASLQLEDIVGAVSVGWSVSKFSNSAKLVAAILWICKTGSCHCLDNVLQSIQGVADEVVSFR